MAIKFKWGVFCRRAIVDRESGETSLIDILPSLKTEVSFSSIQNISSDEVTLSLGRMSVASFFEKKLISEVSEAVEVNLNVKGSFPGVPLEPMDFPFSIDKGLNSSFFVLTLENPVLVVPKVEKISYYTCSFSYKLQGSEIGKVELPITVAITM